MATARLVPGTAPTNQQLPPTAQLWLDFAAAYLSIEGIEANASFVTGDATPAVGDQGKPWLQTDAAGSPIGWYWWDGAAWVPLPIVMASGTSAARPASPTAGQLYLDTDLNCTLVFERGMWRTMDGSPGDIKFVVAASVAAAEAQNPGWSEFTEMRGRSPMGSGTGGGLTARAVNTNYGQETVSLAAANLPAHDHSLTNQLTGPGAHTGVGTSVEGPGSGNDNFSVGSRDTGSVGTGTPFDNLHPVRALVCLTKD